MNSRAHQRSTSAMRLEVFFLIALLITMTPYDLCGQSKAAEFASHATDLTNASSQTALELFVAFANRTVAIRRIECRVPGSIFLVKGEPMEEPVAFRGGFQPGTFFIQPLASVVSGRVESSTNETVYGLLANKAWRLEGGIAYESAQDYRLASDITSIKVRGMERNLMDKVLTLGLSGIVSNGTLRLSKDRQLVAAGVRSGFEGPLMELDSRGRVSKLKLNFVSNPKGSITLGYEYDLGELPWWLPGNILISMEEKRGTFSERYSITRCQFGVMDSRFNGFMPAGFANTLSAEKVVSSNDVSWVVKDTNWIRIETPKNFRAKSSVPRWLVIACLALPTLAIAIFLIQTGLIKKKRV